MSAGGGEAEQRNRASDPGEKVEEKRSFHGQFEPSRDACGGGGHGRNGEDEKGAGGGGGGGGGADGEAGY